MTELKRPYVLQLRHNNSDGFVYAYEVDEMNKYLSEVDKVIAEKDKEIAELKEQVHDYAQGLYVIQARAEKEAQHDKYKRCLAMKKWCLYWANYWETCEPSDCSMFIIKARYYRKWYKHWKKLAEKFKEGK